MRGRASDDYVELIRLEVIWYCNTALAGTETGMRRGTLLIRKIPSVGTLALCSAGQQQRLERQIHFIQKGAFGGTVTTGTWKAARASSEFRTLAEKFRRKKMVALCFGYNWLHSIRCHREERSSEKIWLAFRKG